MFMLNYDFSNWKIFLAVAEPELKQRFKKEWQEILKNASEDDVSAQLNAKLDKVKTSWSKWSETKKILKNLKTLLNNKDRHPSEICDRIANWILYGRAIKNAIQSLEENKYHQSSEKLLVSRKILEEHFEFLYQPLKRFISYRTFAIIENSLPVPKAPQFELVKLQDIERKQEELQPLFDGDFSDTVNQTTRRLNDSVSNSNDVRELLESEQFRVIEAYANILKNDKRTHTFFCINLRVKDKFNELEKFINEIKSAQTLTELQEKLKQFYHGAQRSNYEILNTGQNITTRLFKLKTTTIEKIDAFNKLVNNLRPLI